MVYDKIQVYPGKDAALQEGTKPGKPVNNGQNAAEAGAVKQAKDKGSPILNIFFKKFQNSHSSFGNTTNASEKYLNFRTDRSYGRSRKIP